MASMKRNSMATKSNPFMKRHYPGHAPMGPQEAAVKKSLQKASERKFADLDPLSRVSRQLKNLHEKLYSVPMHEGISSPATPDRNLARAGKQLEGDLSPRQNGREDDRKKYVWPSQQAPQKTQGGRREARMGSRASAARSHNQKNPPAALPVESSAGQTKKYSRNEEGGRGGARTKSEGGKNLARRARSEPRAPQIPDTIDEHPQEEECQEPDSPAESPLAAFGGKDASENLLIVGTAELSRAARWTWTAQGRPLTVHLSNSNLGNKHVLQMVSRSLKKTATLTDLNVSKNDLGVADLWTLCNCLTSAQSLVEAGVPNRTISRPGLSLDVSENQFGDDGALLVADLMQSDRRAIEALTARRCSISDVGATMISRGMEIGRCLRILDLSSNNITAEGAGSLALGVAACPPLEVLDLSNNELHDEGAISFAAAAPAFKNVQRLSLESNSIGPDGAAALGDALNPALPSWSHCLRELSVAGNIIGDSGATALATGVRHIKSIISVMDISHNDIGDAGILVFSRALVENRSLRALNVSLNRFRSETQSVLAQSIVNHPNMTDLTLSDGSVTPADLDKTEEFIRNNNTRIRMTRVSGQKPDEFHQAPISFEDLIESGIEEQEEAGVSEGVKRNENDTRAALSRALKKRAQKTAMMHVKQSGTGRDRIGVNARETESPVRPAVPGRPSKHSPAFSTIRQEPKKQESPAPSPPPAPRPDPPPQPFQRPLQEKRSVLKSSASPPRNVSPHDSEVLLRRRQMKVKSLNSCATSPSRASNDDIRPQQSRPRSRSPSPVIPKQINTSPQVDGSPNPTVNVKCNTAVIEVPEWQYNTEIEQMVADVAARGLGAKAEAERRELEKQRREVEEMKVNAKIRERVEALWLAALQQTAPPWDGINRAAGPSPPRDEPDREGQGGGASWYDSQQHRAEKSRTRPPQHAESSTSPPSRKVAWETTAAEKIVSPPAPSTPLVKKKPSDPHGVVTAFPATDASTSPGQQGGVENISQVQDPSPTGAGVQRSPNSMHHSGMRNAGRNHSASPIESNRHGVPYGPMPVQSPPGVVEWQNHSSQQYLQQQPYNPEQRHTFQPQQQHQFLGTQYPAHSVPHPAPGAFGVPQFGRSTGVTPEKPAVRRFAARRDSRGRRRSSEGRSWYHHKRSLSPPMAPDPARKRSPSHPRRPDETPASNTHRDMSGDPSAPSQSPGRDTSHHEQENASTLEVLTSVYNQMMRKIVGGSHGLKDAAALADQLQAIKEAIRIEENRLLTGERSPESKAKSNPDSHPTDASPLVAAHVGPEGTLTPGRGQKPSRSDIKEIMVRRMERASRSAAGTQTMTPIADPEHHANMIRRINATEETPADSTSGERAPVELTHEMGLQPRVGAEPLVEQQGVEGPMIVRPYPVHPMHLIPVYTGPVAAGAAAPHHSYQMYSYMPQAPAPHMQHPQDGLDVYPNASHAATTAGQVRTTDQANDVKPEKAVSRVTTPGIAAAPTQGQAGHITPRTAVTPQAQRDSPPAEVSATPVTSTVSTAQVPVSNGSPADSSMHRAAENEHGLAPVTDVAGLANGLTLAPANVPATTGVSQPPSGRDSGASKTFQQGGPTPVASVSIKTPSPAPVMPTGTTDPVSAPSEAKKPPSKSGDGAGGILDILMGIGD